MLEKIFSRIIKRHPSPRDPLLYKTEDENIQSGTLHTIYNFGLSILGSAPLSFPYMVNEAGFATGIIILIAVAATSDYTIQLLVRAAHLSGTSSYNGIVKESLGTLGSTIFVAILIIYEFLCMIYLNITLGDTITKLFHYIVPENNLQQHQQFYRVMIILFGTVCITLPLSLHRHVSKLAKFSCIGLLVCGILLISMIIRAPDMEISGTSESWKMIQPSGIVGAIGICASGFICTPNAILFYNSMKNKSEKRFGMLTHVSMIISVGVGIAYCAVGYYTFKGMTQGDILENYCPDDDLINVNRFLVAVTSLISFPFLVFVVRNAVESWFESAEEGYAKHFWISFGIVGIAFGISTIINGLGVAATILGMAGIPIGFIFPPLCFLKLHDDPLLSREKMGPLVVLTFGIIVLLTASMQLVNDVFSESFESSSAEMPYCGPISVTNLTTL